MKLPFCAAPLKKRTQLVKEYEIRMEYFYHLAVNSVILLSTLEVEPQYAGARIEGDVVTLEFVKKMLDDFKNQKCLHKRYANSHSWCSDLNSELFLLLCSNS